MFGLLHFLGFNTGLEQSADNLQHGSPQHVEGNWKALYRLRNALISISLLITIGVYVEMEFPSFALLTKMGRKLSFMS
jgi:hypothetical protein